MCTCVCVFVCVYVRACVCVWYLGHFGFGVCDEEGHVIDFILNHKVLLLSLKVLQKHKCKDLMSLILIN